MIKTKLVLTMGLFLSVLSSNPAVLAEVDCGMAGSEDSVSGTDFAGYWRTTLGTMRLVRLDDNTIEGPATSSEYLKGKEVGNNTFEGRFAEDAGRYMTGRFSIALTQEGHCLSGRFNFDNDKAESMEFKGFRILRPSLVPFKDHYELSVRTEHLKHLVGGVLPFDQLDGSDTLASSPVQNAEFLMPMIESQASDNP